MNHLSIIVPAYNEAKTIASVMKLMNEACPTAQIIYVDDGSKDDTLAIMKRHAHAHDVILTKPNGGKGSAIRLGLSHATSAHTVIQDADSEYDPTDIATLLKEATNHPGSAVFGSRFLRDNPNIYKRFLLGNKVMTRALNVLFWAHLTDSYTCYKLLPTDLFRSLNLTANGFEMEAEICAKCLKKGIKIREVPISYKPRTIAEGKKISWKDAVKGMLMMLRIRLGGH